MAERPYRLPWPVGHRAARPGSETGVAVAPPERSPKIPPGAGPAPWRRTFATLCVAQLLALLGFSMAQPFLPLYVQQLGLPDPAAAARWAGAMTAAGALVMAVLAPVWGAVADRHGRKPMVARALFGGGLTVALASLVRSPAQLLALRTVQGAFSGTVSATRTLVAGVVPAAELAFALGMVQTAMFVGNSAGPLLGGVLADRLGYRAVFLLTGLILGLAGVAVVLLVHEDFTPLPPAPGPGGKRGAGALGAPLGAAFAVVLEIPGLLALIATLFLVQAGVSAVTPVLALFVASLVGSGGGPAAASEGGGSIASVAGLILGATAVTGAVAAGLAGKLSGRIGHERMIAICAIGGGLLYFPQALVVTPWQLLGLRALLGVFDGGLMPSVMATIALRSPASRRGMVFGLTATATSLGNAIGPVAGASAATALGLRASFLFTGSVLLAAGVWVALAVATRPPPPG